VRGHDKPADKQEPAVHMMCTATQCSTDSHLATQPVAGTLWCLASTPALVVPLDGVSPEAAARNLWAGKQAHKGCSEQVVHPTGHDLHIDASGLVVRQGAESAVAIGKGEEQALGGPRILLGS
jgi:hypothetical protein